MHILLVDDHSLVREALRPLLMELVENVSIMECGSFDSALEMADGIDKLDMLLLDLHLPGMSGIANIEIFRSRFPETAVVILSGNYVRQDVVKSFEYGAAGFIPKGLSITSLKNALKVVLAGERYVPSDILDVPAANLKGYREISPDNPLHGLTHRQREVLDALTGGLTNKAIAKRLNVQETTVKLHLRNIFKKLGARNRTEAVRIAIKHGWTI
ncbi:MAG: response regulator transcription factor [Proteobacteria bacterium]|nr:response regulator transcription factor [Pseudomonadota bacterium]